MPTMQKPLGVNVGELTHPWHGVSLMHDHVGLDLFHAQFKCEIQKQQDAVEDSIQRRREAFEEEESRLVSNAGYPPTSKILVFALPSHQKSIIDHY
jgi:hypothetical protein